MPTPTPTRPFDPASPLPRRTLANIIATGEGRANPGRLSACAMLGAGGTAAVLSAAPERWLLAMPLVSLAAFGAWGLAARKTHELDARHRHAPRLRRSLRATRGTAIAVGCAAAAVGVAGAVATLLGSR